jgi:hypothetical protein
MTEPTRSELQFETAEDAEPATSEARCKGCNAPFLSYFDINGVPVCAACKDKFLEMRQRSHVPDLLRATVLGVLAAIAGAALFYGIVALTGYQFGLVAIVVGLLVGFAVRKGSRGRGGWRYQALAVGLCYLSICSTYVPFVVKAIQEHRNSPPLPIPGAPAGKWEPLRPPRPRWRRPHPPPGG